MATKPTETITFEPSGGAVVAIPLAKQAVGVLPAERFPAQYMSWFMRTMSRLFNYVVDGVFTGDVTIDSLLSKVARINSITFRRDAGTLLLPHTCFSGGTLQAQYLDAFTAVKSWIVVRPGYKITSVEFDYRCSDGGDGLSFAVQSFSHASPTGTFIALDDAGTSSSGADATKVLTVSAGGWVAPAYPTMVLLSVECSTPSAELPRLHRARVVTVAA